MTLARYIFPLRSPSEGRLLRHARCGRSSGRRRSGLGSSERGIKYLLFHRRDDSFSDCWLVMRWHRRIRFLGTLSCIRGKGENHRFFEYRLVGRRRRRNGCHYMLKCVILGGGSHCSCQCRIIDFFTTLRRLQASRRLGRRPLCLCFGERRCSSHCTFQRRIIDLFTRCFDREIHFRRQRSLGSRLYQRRSRKGL